MSNEWDTEEYEPRHSIAPADRKLMDACYVAGMTTLFLIACVGEYLAVEALRYDLGGLFLILMVPSSVGLVYMLGMLCLEDAWRDLKGWRERRGRTTDT